MKRLLISVAFVLGLSCFAFGEEAPKLPAGQHWFHLMTNLLNPKSMDQAIKLVERASKSGYNGVQLNDVKYIKYKLQPATYVDCLKKFRKACTDNKIQLIVGVCPVGYDENVLALDPNLAEGLPVRDAAFIVKDGKLIPDASAAPVLVNPDFSDVDAATNHATGWVLDKAGKTMFVDTTVKTPDGKNSIRMQDPKTEQGSSRVTQMFKVKPWQYCHVSVMMKMEGNTSKDMRIMAIGNGGFPLNWQPLVSRETKLPVKDDTDWTTIDMTFDTLDSTEVTLYMGTWDAREGKVWYGDVKLEQGGFVNIIRRDSLPLTVKNNPGVEGGVPTVYEEGKDFSAVSDKLMMNDPNPGYFTRWHAAPAVTIPAGSRLKEGQKVLVGYNFTVDAGKASQMCVCMNEPKLYTHFEDEVTWIRDNFKPDVYFLGFDEIRLQGWDDTCVKSGKSCAQTLADCVKKCTQIVEKVAPGHSIATWNDMFDPFHNGAKLDKEGKPFRMYMVKDTPAFFGAYEGIGKEVCVMNWSGKDKMADSFKFWSDRGCQQIISGDVPKATPDNILKRMDTAKGLPGVVGAMYTTWTNDWTDNFEKYVKMVNDWEQKAGPYKP